MANKIADIISPGSEVIRTYYYHSLPYKGHPPSVEESNRFANKQKFFNALKRKSRFEVRLGRLARRGPDKHGNYRYEQKKVDVLLSIDLVALSAKGRITHAAILAGDSDFVPAINMSKEETVIFARSFRIFYLRKNNYLQ